MNIFDVETLLSLGLTNQAISIWQVYLYIFLMVPFLLLGRARLCLLITYLFSYYLAFLIYWREFLQSESSLVPFILYAGSGLLIVVLFVVGSVYEHARLKRNPEA